MLEQIDKGAYSIRGGLAKAQAWRRRTLILVITISRPRLSPLTKIPGFTPACLPRQSFFLVLYSATHARNKPTAKIQELPIELAGGTNQCNTYDDCKQELKV